MRKPWVEKYALSITGKPAKPTVVSDTTPAPEPSGVAEPEDRNARICAKCGQRYGLHFWPTLGGRCNADRDGEKFQAVASPSVCSESAQGEIPEYAREMYETLKVKDAAMNSRTKSPWEQELFKYIWVTNGQLFCNPEKLEEVIEQIRNEGRDSVLYIRCTKHQGGPQYNKDEYGQECTECAIQALASKPTDTPQPLTLESVVPTREKRLEDALRELKTERMAAQVYTLRLRQLVYAGDANVRRRAEREIDELSLASVLEYARTNAEKALDALEE